MKAVVRAGIFISRPPKAVAAVVLDPERMVERTSDLGQGDEPSRRVYAVTEAGREGLQAWFASGVTPEHQRDEFFIKLMVALASRGADPARIIQTQRAHLYRELHASTQLRDSYDPKTEMAQILLLDKVTMHLEADLRWLDMTEMRLEEVKGQPLPEPEMRPRGRPRKERSKAAGNIKPID